MARIFSILLIAATLSLLSCDSGGSNSLFDQDSEKDSCDQKLIDNITTVSVLCSNWDALGYTGYSDCKANENDRMLTLFLLCKVEEKDTDEEE